MAAIGDGETRQGKPERLLTLDAMRGLAALIVILFHARGFVDLVPDAYLAVDFFFLLSGVVIGRAYTPRFERGLLVRNFMKERVIRVYPLLMLGLLIGFADGLVQFAMHSAERPSVKFLTIGMFFNMLILPSPVSSYSLFPFNIPAWSLSFELIANFVFAVLLVKLTSRVLSLTLVLMAAGLAWVAFQPEAFNVGDAWVNVLPGLLRTLFSFGAGILMSRVLHVRTLGDSLWSIAPMLALCVLLAAPVLAYQGLYDLLLVFIAFPLIVWAGSRVNPPQFLRRIAHLLGDTSYAVYAIHYPLLFIVAAIAKRLGVPVQVWLPVFMVALLGLCHYLVKYYDAPLRRWLGKRFVPRRDAGRVAEGTVGA